MHGFGRSSRPHKVAGYALPQVVTDATGVLDALGIDAAHLVAHDWAAAVAWLTTMLHPLRVLKLVAISVPHPLARRSMRQHEIAWDQLLFQFTGMAEATIEHDGWAVAPPTHRIMGYRAMHHELQADDR